MRYGFELLVWRSAGDRKTGRLTIQGPRFPRIESREGRERIWSCQSMIAPVEGILPGISVGHATEGRLRIICIPDPSESTIHPGRRLHERLWAENIVGLLRRTLSHFNRGHRNAEYDQQRYRGHVRVLQSERFSPIEVGLCS